MGVPVVGEPVELMTLDMRAGELVWMPATVARVNEFFIVFRCADGREPAYGPDDEGKVWRRPHVRCPTCSGSGWVPK